MQFTINFPPPESTEDVHYRAYIQKEIREICETFSHLGTITTDLQNAENQFHKDAYTGFQVVFQIVPVDRHRDRNDYIKILHIWGNKCSSYSPKLMPILYISDTKAFERCREMKHDIKINAVSFGTMPFFGQYNIYYSFKNEALPSGSAIFYHDQRKIDIKLKSEMHFTLNYRDIRKILVNRGQCTKLYVDLLHPPVLNKKTQRFNKRTHTSYEISQRTATLSDVEASTIGKSNVIQLNLPTDFETEEIISRLQYRCDKIPIGFANFKDIGSSVPSDPTLDFRYFSCNYIFSAILHRNFSVAQQFKDGVYLPPYSYCLATENQLENALTDILFMIDSGYVIYFPQALAFLIDFYAHNTANSSYLHYTIPEKSCFIRRVTLTPTRILMYPPEIMAENRVLRKYNPDFALRISFRDDSMSKLNYCASFADENILNNAIVFPMTQGLKIKDRHFAFLGWSNSQIRDHGVWMYAKDDKGYSASDIRQWMGNFSHIHSVSKYMARMGQSFTQTEDTIAIPLCESNIKTEIDIEHGLEPSTGKSYCFSDGIGKISVDLAAKVHESLGHDKHCSAFQIRYGGYKGMLVVDPTLKDTKIVFRESMKKFDSPQNIQLEIAELSKPSTLQLNRPFITILEQLGVKCKIFLQLQEDMLRTLTDMLLDEEKAAHYLKAYAPKIFNYGELSGSFLGLTTEPFMRSILLALHRNDVEKIKTKANINIDPSEGRNMFGVLDETGTLNYEQVFVQYTSDISSGETTTKTEILKGPVLVTKNPCMHPGDVRMFKAIDVPALHHIVDCIVFPQKGPRPHPNEMAGSDLDGDKYTVLWKKELFFQRGNSDPAEYPSQNARVVGQVDEASMIQFLKDYIKNDQVGNIATAHLVQADRLGLWSRECMAIARLFSVAVDFAKHGNPVRLDPTLRADQLPDFIERDRQKSYRSNHVLAKMFRICKDFEVETKHWTNKYTNIKVDETLVYPGWEAYKEQAIESRDRYNTLLFSILQTYGILHEAEAFSGAFTHLHCRYNERKDKDEIKKIIVSRLKALNKNIKKEFMSEFASRSSSLKNIDVELLQKASAWYIVTYSDPQNTYLSFPWHMSKFLGDIKARALPPEAPFSSSVVQNIEAMIEAFSATQMLESLSPQAISMLSLHTFSCNEIIVTKALQILIYWATEMRIIQVPGKAEWGFMFFPIFMKVFIYIAQQNHYLDSNGNQRKTAKMCSAALCLAFFQFCVQLRFCNKVEVKKIFPFDVYKHTRLAKLAMFTYHQIAISGSFNQLSVGSSKSDEYIELDRPLPINCQQLHDTAALRRAEAKLIQETGVEYVSIRPIEGVSRAFISAGGKAFTVKRLEQLLRKVDPLQLFSSLV